MYNLKLLISIDEFDRYCEEWKIKGREITEDKVNGSWYLETYNKDLAFALENDAIAKIVSKEEYIKADKIDQIKKLLKVHGCFNIGELDYFDSAPCVFSYGSVVGVVEYFTEDYADVNIYQTSSMSSDPIETTESQYEDFSIDILNEILYLCKMWERQSSVVDEL